MKTVLLSSLALTCVAGIEMAMAQGPGYVIITTTNIVSASTQLTNFVASKQAHGFSVQVVSNTATGQGGWGGGTGDTAANNIRAWLQANYTNASSEVVIDYVLLVGNPTSDVPMKASYPRSTNEVCLTDYYYADLTGVWDINSNGFYGEYSDYTNGGPDRAYEVAVGRIPHYGPMSALDKILAKIVAYENTSAPTTAWRHRTILAMPDLADNLFWGDKFGSEKIQTPTLDPNGWYTRLFNYSDCSEANVLNEWTNSHYGTVFWLGDGVPDGTAIYGYRDWWYGWVCEMTANSTPQLNDSEPVFSFFCSCSAGNPDSTNNLTYSLLKNGGVSVVGASTITFYLQMLVQLFPPIFTTVWHEPGTNPRIESDFASRLISESMAAGDALCDLRADNAPFSGGDEPAMWWMNYLAYNLYGDPAIGIRSVRFAGPIWSF